MKKKIAYISKVSSCRLFPTELCIITLKIIILFLNEKKKNGQIKQNDIKLALILGAARKINR